MTPRAPHPDSVDPRILDALDAVPGGEVVDDYTAYWPALEMTLTVPAPGDGDAVGSCANGSICAYSGSGLTGSKLSWSSCGTFSTAAIPGGVVRSIADARSTGSLQARNGTTVVATASAQSWNNVVGTTDNVRCT